MGYFGAFPPHSEKSRPRGARPAATTPAASARPVTSTVNHAPALPPRKAKFAVGRGQSPMASPNGSRFACAVRA
jgi:hypothetical protein